MSLYTSRAETGAGWKRPRRERTHRNPNKNKSEVANQQEMETSKMVIHAHPTF